MKEILETFQQFGNGDKDLLLAVLKAKQAEEDRLASIIQSRLHYLSHPPIHPSSTSHSHSHSHFHSLTSRYDQPSHQHQHVESSHQRPGHSQGYLPIHGYQDQSLTPSMSPSSRDRSRSRERSREGLRDGEESFPRDREDKDRERGKDSSRDLPSLKEAMENVERFDLSSTISRIEKQDPTMTRSRSRSRSRVGLGGEEEGKEENGRGNGSGIGSRKLVVIQNQPSTNVKMKKGVTSIRQRHTSSASSSSSSSSSSSEDDISPTTSHPSHFIPSSTTHIHHHHHHDEHERSHHHLRENVGPHEGRRRSSDSLIDEVIDRRSLSPRVGGGRNGERMSIFNTGIPTSTTTVTSTSDMIHVKRPSGLEMLLNAVRADERREER